MSNLRNTSSKPRPRERDRPTLKTIAKLTGLAVPTVSRALSDAPDIGISTKERVRAVAKEIGYQRDRAAVRLRTGKTNVLALVMGANKDVMNQTAQLISSIAAEIRGSAYHMVVLPYFEDEAPIDPIRYVVETASADGVILNRITPNDPRVSYLREHGFPFVTHGRTEDCHLDPHFDFDNAEYARVAVEELAKRGRKHILLIAPVQDQSYAGHMIEGCRLACDRQGLQFTLLEGGSSDMESFDVARPVTSALGASPTIDGIVCGSPSAAIGATLAAEKLGKVLGESIDIAGKEAIPFLEAFRQEMIIVHEDVGEAGAFMARALVKSIDDPNAEPMQKVVAPSEVDKSMKRDI